MLRRWWAQKLSNTMNNNLHLILPSSLPHLPGSGNCKAHFLTSLLLPLHCGPCHFLLLSQLSDFSSSRTLCSTASVVPTVCLASGWGQSSQLFRQLPAGLQLLSALPTFCTHVSLITLKWTLPTIKFYSTFICSINVSHLPS